MLNQRLARYWGSANWYDDIDFGGKIFGTGLALPPFMQSVSVSNFAAYDK
jgi:hypothetical protein